MSRVLSIGSSGKTSLILIVLNLRESTQDRVDRLFSVRGPEKARAQSLHHLNSAVRPVRYMYVALT